MNQENAANPVLAVTSALVLAGLAFEFSPFQEHVPHHAIWLLEFDGGQEARLWLEDDEEHLALAVFLRTSTLSDEEDTRKLDDDLWSIRVRTSQKTVAMNWLRLVDLEELETCIYELLEGARKEERRAERPVRQQKASKKGSREMPKKVAKKRASKKAPVKKAAKQKAAAKGPTRSLKKTTAT